MATTVDEVIAAHRAAGRLFDACRELVVRGDGGAAYLEIMRNLRRGARDHRAVVDSRTVPYPVQVIWGAKDPILPLRRHGWRAMIAAGVPSIHTLPAKHFLQEDHPPSSVSSSAPSPPAPRRPAGYAS